MRSIGLPWLVALVVIPLSIAAIGYGAWGPRTADGSNGGLATVGPSGAPKVDLAPLSIVRGANGITLSGNVPDDSAKAILLKSLKGALPAGVNIVDQIQLNPNIDALDFSHAGPIFRDSASITDFTFTVNGDTITLAGTAGSQGQKNTIEGEVKRTWSRLNVVDNLTVNGSTPSASGADAINVPLSSQRDQAVADFLVAHGVAGDHLVVRGLGSIDPVASNDTADGRAKNRRAEIVVS